MRFVQYLQEEYITMITGKHWLDHFKGTILCNPDSKELRSLEDDEVRFLIDKHNNKIYVWPAKIVHYEVVDKLKKMKLITMDKGYMDLDEFWKKYYLGVGKIRGNKIRWTADSDYADDVDDQSLIDNIPDLKWTHQWVVWAA